MKQGLAEGPRGGGAWLQAKPRFCDEVRPGASNLQPENSVSSSSGHLSPGDGGPITLGERSLFWLEQEMEASRRKKKKKELAPGCTEKGFLIWSGNLGKSSKRIVENQVSENSRQKSSCERGRPDLIMDTRYLNANTGLFGGLPRRLSARESSCQCRR